ncbi:class I SAM-dependent methyltransferase [Micromonospora parva]|uniref:class I SAM-dependent methyltransferase n=1 Tax=Micromonospora parva TaxID=1464048 RepID=UPI0033D0E1F2
MQTTVDRAGLGRLISAAGGSADGITAVIDDLGADAVAATVVGELLHRADVPAGPDVAVQVGLRHGDATIRYGLQIGSTGVAHLPSGAGEPVGTPDASLTQDLTEVVRSLFGPRGAQSSASRVVHWGHLEDPSAFDRPLPAYDVVRRLVDALDRPYDIGLAELCVRYGSDKWGHHTYPRRYEQHFGPLRDQPLTILEIGVGGFGDQHRGGASLEVWRRYFPRALVYGLDIVDKSHLTDQRVTVLQGDQSSPTDLARVVEVMGRPDIVIDDGSHVSAHLLASFASLFPVLRHGGLYVMEDLQTSYWPTFGGRAGTYDDPATSLGFLKTLVDGLHHEEIVGRTPAFTDPDIGGVHFYHNLAFVEKERNLDGGAPSWIPRGVRQRAGVPD